MSSPWSLGLELPPRPLSSENHRPAPPGPSQVYGFVGSQVLPLSSFTVQIRAACQRRYFGSVKSQVLPKIQLMNANRRLWNIPKWAQLPQQLLVSLVASVLVT